MNIGQAMAVTLNRQDTFDGTKSGIPDDPGRQQEIVDAFHKHYFAHTNTLIFWGGYPALKCPMDMWMYQEIMYLTLPEVIVECGTMFGGSALFLANVYDMMGNGEVITIDIQKRTAIFPDMPKHPRISYILGDSTDPEVVAAITEHVAGRSVMVILDSDHRQEHVAKELEAYAPLVKPGHYLIVEDTNLNGHPVAQGWGAGPMEAVRDFLARHPEFECDRSRERFWLTFNPGGYLKRKEVA